MAIRQSLAYALRTLPLGEADLIVEFFTLEHGRVRAVARSARRIRSRFGSAFELFTRSRLVWFQRDKDDLGRVSSVDLDRSWFEALGGLEQSAEAAYMAEITIAFTPERDPAPHIFRLLGAILDAIEAGEPPSLMARYLEVWLLRLSGLFPDLTVCGGCGGKLPATPWLDEAGLEFVCGRECGSLVGRQRLTPSARQLLLRILGDPPAGLSGRLSGAAGLRSLRDILRTLVCGHLGRAPRSLRVLGQLERALHPSATVR